MEIAALVKVPYKQMLGIQRIIMKPVQIKVLRIGTGLGLIFVAGRYIYLAITLEIVEWRNDVYSLQDSSISFYFYSDIFILAIILGIALVKVGWQDNCD
jgi:hypothetical protein